MVIKAKKNFDYYDFSKIFSYNAVYNLIVGARGVGKTYGVKLIGINNYLNKGEEWIYVRRYQTELGTKSTFFDDIKEIFPHLGFRVNGNLMQLTHEPDEEKPRWETFGYFRVLSKSNTQKSASYPKVTMIVFDEFIIEKGHVRYLNNEVHVFNNFYLTVDRYQDRTRVFMLANSISIVNPYFIEWDISPTREFVTKKFGDDIFIVTHFVDSEMFTKQVLETRFGKFISGTGFGDFAAGNIFADGHDYLVARKESKAIYWITIETKTGTFSVWKTMDGHYYVQQKRPKEEIIVVTDITLMMEGKTYLDRTTKIMQYIRTGFNTGRMFFDSPRTRNVFATLFTR